MVNVLVVGAHPDDIELGLGATVALLARQGHQVAMLDLTNGEPTPKGDPATRMEEAARAARILGAAARVTLDLPNRELTDTVAARHKVAAVYRQLRPHLLFVQGEVDAHPDHIDGAKVMNKARFDAKLTKSAIPGEPWWIPRLLRYHASHLKLHVAPSFIMDVTDTFALKLEAVRAYQSQFAWQGREEWIVQRLTEQAAYFGGLIGTRFGEPVMCDEPVGLTGLRDLV